MKINKILKSGLSYLLSGTQVAFDGLSSARQIVDFTSAPWAKYAACGATIVEGEIYRKNITEGFNRFSLLSKKSLWKYLIVEKFESDLEKNNLCEKLLKEQIINFLKKIKEYSEENYRLNDKETSDLDSYILEIEDSSLTETCRKNIQKSFGNIKESRAEDSRFILEEHIEEFKKINQQFKDLIEEKKLNCPFLINYNANLEYLKLIKSSHENELYAVQVEKNLKLLKKQLIKAVVKEENCQYLINTDTLNADLIKILKGEVSEKAKKLWFLRLGMLFSLGVGVGIGVITFFTFPAVLISFGFISLSVISAVIWPLAILAAISYAILIYNTITDLILNETLSKWWKELNLELERTYGQTNILKYWFLVIGKSLTQIFSKLKNWFKFQEQEGYFSWIFRMTLSAAVLVFGIIAALTTGYTAFIQLQNYVSLWACVITALPLMLSDLLFTLKNSFDTLGLLTGISVANLLIPLKNSYKNLKMQISTENFLQWQLHLLRIPLKLMVSILKLLIFGFHVFFTSVASDRFLNFPCWLTVFFAAGSELLTDICPLFGSQQGGHHDHGGIFNLINILFFIIPATFLGIINCLFSQLNRWTDTDSLVFGFKEAIKQEWQQFDIIHKHEHLTSEASSFNEPDLNLPKDVVIQKAINICDKQIDRLKKGFFNSGLANQKVIIFEKYKQRLQQKDGDQNNNFKLESEKKDTLKSHRFFKRKAETKSIQKMEKIEALMSHLVNDNDHVLSNGHATVVR